MTIQPKRNIATNLSFYQCLHGWSETKSPAHALCTRITKIRDWKRTPWVWHVHFTPIGWRTATQRYYAVLLNTLHEATNCTFTHPKRFNPTFPNMEHKPSWSKLNADLKAFLVGNYKTDFELYDRHCSSGRYDNASDEPCYCTKTSAPSVSSSRRAGWNASTDLSSQMQFHAISLVHRSGLKFATARTTNKLRVLRVGSIGIM